MNTNQDTTLTNQDALPDNVKLFITTMFIRSEKAIKDYDIEYNVFLNSEYQEAWLLWQVATKASEQRIQELLVKIGDTEQKYQEKLNDLTEKCDELTASNNQLLDALEDAANDIPGWFDKYKQAIYATPAQSLAEHDNELLDKVIKILSDNGIFGDGIIGKDILKLKVTP